MPLMGKAFTSRNKQKNSIFKLLLPVLLFVMIVVVVLVGVQNVSTSASEERLAAMEQAVLRTVVQCYAIEGRYPSSLAYLEDNYGLIIDDERYIYHYQVYGANLLPGIAVFAKK